MKRQSWMGVALMAGASVVVLGVGCSDKGAVAPEEGSDKTAAVQGQEKKGLPVFEVDYKFPQMPEGVMLGAVGGAAPDSHGNVWVHQRPHTIPEYNAALNGYKAAPPVIEFDPSGKYLQGFGGPAPNGEYEWFYRESDLRSAYAPCAGCGTGVRGNGDHRAANGEHGIFVDHLDNVWLTGNGGKDGQILKFSNTGKFLMQIGKAIPDGSVNSADTTHVARAAAVAVNPTTNELYVADGYGNRRIIVFDAATGAYKRHWGAYGNKPDDTPKPQRILAGPGNPQFNTVHGIAIAKDGTLYVADRANNRIQEFTPEGKFLREAYNQRDSAGTGSAFGVAISPDQRWLYVADSSHERVAIMDRQTLQVVGAVGRPGAYTGEFTNLHSLAIDAQGNLITGESQGYRVQKFLYKGLSGQ